MKIKKGSPKEIRNLFEAIREKKRSGGEPYTTQDFVEDLGLKSRYSYQKWVSEPQINNPSQQTITLMNMLAKKEGV